VNTTRFLTLLACSQLALPTSLFAWEPGAGEITGPRTVLKTLRPEPAAKEADPGNPNDKDDQ
jgi:hypothetical protein